MAVASGPAFINTNINFCGAACGSLVYTDAIGKRLQLRLLLLLLLLLILMPRIHPWHALLVYVFVVCVYLIKVKGAQHALQFA